MTYEELVALARDDPNVLGLVLTGSRGTGTLVRGDSDWDVRLVVRDEVVDEYRSKLATPHGSPAEVVVFSRTEFEREGQPGSPSAWDRPSYVHAQVVVARPRPQRRDRRLGARRRLAARQLAGMGRCRLQGAAIRKETRWSP